jgi:hypothetical protein
VDTAVLSGAEGDSALPPAGAPAGDAAAESTADGDAVAAEAGDVDTLDGVDAAVADDVIAALRAL